MLGRGRLLGIARSTERAERVADLLEHARGRAAAGHVLVVPGQHVESFYELDEEPFVGLMLVVKRMASVIEAVYQPRKVGMLAAGFDVAHAHLHVLPMHDYHDLTSKVILEGKRASPTEEELRAAAEQIKRGLVAQGAV